MVHAGVWSTVDTGGFGCVESRLHVLEGNVHRQSSHVAMAQSASLSSPNVQAANRCQEWRQDVRKVGGESLPIQFVVLKEDQAGADKLDVEFRQPTWYLLKLSQSTRARQRRTAARDDRGSPVWSVGLLHTTPVSYANKVIIIPS